MSDDYPYRNIIYTDEDRMKIYKELSKLDLKKANTQRKSFVKSIDLPIWYYLYHGQFTYIMYDPKLYEYYMLGDLFVDECRSKCRFGNNVAPLEFYNKNKDKLISQIKAKGDVVTPFTLREEIYFNTIECSTHNPLIIKFFIKKFDAKNVIDVSSGWGDRLIGSILSDVNLYFGTDPNPCLHPHYEEIIKMFQPLTTNKGTYTIVESKFEDVKLPDVKFDIMYTSPPYFTYEKYENSTDDPNFTKDEDEWLDSFVYPSVKKIIEKLRLGGTMVFYFSQEKGASYIEKWMKHMLALPYIHYIGNHYFSSTEMKYVHPIFMFKYSETIPKKLYNPPIQVKTYSYKKIKLNVIREDLLMGGSKQRAMVPLIQNMIKHDNINELIYFGASNGYAIVALAYTLFLLKSNIQMRIYHQKTNLPEARKITDLARSIYPRVKFVYINGPMRNGWPLIDEHLQKNKRSRLIPFGLKTDEFKQLYQQALTKYVTKYANVIKRLWMVVGSGTIFSVLYNMLPNTHFCLVQVGKKVDLEGYERYTLYTSTIKLYNEINVGIPYPTAKSYDGKIYEFDKHFKDDDWIWNTAGIHAIL